MVLTKRERTRRRGMLLSTLCSEPNGPVEQTQEGRKIVIVGWKGEEFRGVAPRKWPRDAATPAANVGDRVGGDSVLDW